MRCTGAPSSRSRISSSRSRADPLIARRNLEVVRRSFDAFNRRDLGELLAVYSEDAELNTLTSTLVEGEAYRGHDGIRRYVETIGETWEEFELVPEDFHDIGERVVVLGRWRARGKGSGAQYETTLGWLFELRDARIELLRSYREPADALAAGRGTDEPGAP